MAGLISTGIAGFLSSAKFTGKQIANKAGKLVPEVVSTFVSGLSGWMMTVRGDLECRSVYARDKFITNEYVYNRIRVTEDEEIISSSIKIASFADNEDGTWLIIPDLREGDINPLAAGDLMMGYYHNPANSSVVYAVQKMTVKADPDLSQGVIVTLEEGSAPYHHMIIVRVGNTTDVDRQSFIRISSRTNCQYFYDGINSWTAYGDPNNVKCAIGKADIGLIPAWAAKAVGSVKRWFGLIADGVILRGTFILKNDKTIEDELNGRETVLRSDFEIRETGITGKWEETITAAESASNAEKSVTKMVGDFQVTAELLAANFTKTVETATTDATGKITKATEAATSSLTISAEELKSSFEQSFTDAEGKIMKEIGTQVTQSAKEWKVEVMGADADGNPNSVIAAINATPEGIEIEGKKVKITGELLAEIIKTSGLNINDNFVVGKDGKVEMQGKLSTSSNGKRIEIDPTSNSIRTIDENGNQSLMISFKSTPEIEPGIDFYGSDITLKSYRGAIQVPSYEAAVSTIKISDDDISIESKYYDATRKLVINPFGIFFYKDDVLTKGYGA